MVVRTFVAALTLLSAPIPAVANAQLASEQDRREALHHFRQGQELLSAERFEQAAEAFQRAIAREPLFTHAHCGLGQAFMALQRYASAIKAFADCREAYLRLYGLAEVGRIELERQREDLARELTENIRRVRQEGRNLEAARLEARLQDLQRRRTSNTPAFELPAEVSLALGSAYFRNGQLDAAEREWLAAVAVNSRLGEAHNNLAALYAMTGRRAAAEDAVRAAERAGFRVHPQLKEDIRQMR